MVPLTRKQYGKPKQGVVYDSKTEAHFLHMYELSFTCVKSLPMVYKHIYKGFNNALANIIDV